MFDFNINKVVLFALLLLSFNIASPMIRPPRSVQQNMQASEGNNIWHSNFRLISSAVERGNFNLALSELEDTMLIRNRYKAYFRNNVDKASYLFFEVVKSDEEEKRQEKLKLMEFLRPFAKHGFSYKLKEVGRKVESIKNNITVGGFDSALKGIKGLIKDYGRASVSLYINEKVGNKDSYTDLIHTVIASMGNKGQSVSKSEYNNKVTKEYVNYGLEIIRLLLEAGVDVNGKSYGQRTPLLVLVRNLVGSVVHNEEGEAKFSPNPRRINFETAKKILKLLLKYRANLGLGVGNQDVQENFMYWLLDLEYRSFRNVLGESEINRRRSLRKFGDEDNKRYKVDCKNDKTSYCYGEYDDSHGSNWSSAREAFLGIRKKLIKEVITKEDVVGVNKLSEALRGIKYKVLNCREYNCDKKVTCSKCCGECKCTRCDYGLYHTNLNCNNCGGNYCSLEGDKHYINDNRYCLNGEYMTVCNRCDGEGYYCKECRGRCLVCKEKLKN